MANRSAARMYMKSSSFMDHMLPILENFTASRSIPAPLVTSWMGVRTSFFIVRVARDSIPGWTCCCCFMSFLSTDHRAVDTLARDLLQYPHLVLVGSCAGPWFCGYSCKPLQQTVCWLLRWNTEHYRTADTLARALLQHSSYVRSCTVLQNCGRPCKHLC